MHFKEDEEIFFDIFVFRATEVGEEKRFLMMVFMVTSQPALKI